MLNFSRIIQDATVARPNRGPINLPGIRPGDIAKDVGGAAKRTAQDMLDLAGQAKDLAPGLPNLTPILIGGGVIVGMVLLIVVLK